jgi:hypothetical protein
MLRRTIEGRERREEEGGEMAQLRFFSKSGDQNLKGF